MGSAAAALGLMMMREGTLVNDEAGLFESDAGAGVKR